METIRPGIYPSAEAIEADWPRLRAAKQRIVFTNGCFDLLHAGHVLYLEEARALGDMLVLGLNQDDSIRRLKGPTRPIVPFGDRATVLTGLRAVDLVVGFFEDTPYNLIRTLQPDLLVKGGDWQVSEIVGADLVMAGGGEVRSLAFKPGSSTTNIVEKVLANHGDQG